MKSRNPVQGAVTFYQYVKSKRQEETMKIMSKKQHASQRNNRTQRNGNMKSNFGKKLFGELYLENQRHMLKDIILCSESRNV